MSKVVTLRELMKKYPSVKLQDGDTWGDWVYNEKCQCLEFKPKRYSIPLDRCVSANQVLNWIVHIFVKNWGQKAIVDLIQALHDVFDLYSLADNGLIPDIKEHLKKRAYIKNKASNERK